MHKLREILRLKFSADLSDRQIATSCGVSRSTVSTYVQRARRADLDWTAIESLDEPDLIQRLQPAPTSDATVAMVIPDWVIIDRELKRKGVTRILLWREYRDKHPDGLQYSHFCDRYRQWRRTQSPVMRQHHLAGEKLFVDYAGMTVDIVDRHTGEVRAAQIFVATLGASNYCYVEATWTQSLADWLGSHRRAFDFLGGVPQAAVPDNLKSGVTKACFYEPEINRSYLDLACHYNIAIIPTRVRKPRDKAKVESHVLIVERQLLAPLRDQVFFSLDAFNAVLAEGLHTLNHQPMQKLGVSRHELFVQVDRPALKPLPAQPYVFAQWKRAKVHLDYHVELERHCYSVPHHLIGQHVDIRFNADTVEIFVRHQRLASHRRQTRRGGHTTLTVHMPKAHQRAGNLTPKSLLVQAQKVGIYTERWVQLVLEQRPHPEQGFRTCLGALKLAKRYSLQRLEAACQRALLVNSLSYGSLQSMLAKGMDRKPLPDLDQQTSLPLPAHANVRGSDYFH